MSYKNHFQTLRPIGTSEAVSFSATSTQSAVIPDHCFEVRLTATEDCFIEVGKNPTAAVNTSMFISGDKAERYFHVHPGEKIAVIQEDTSGTLYITPMGR